MKISSILLILSVLVPCAFGQFSSLPPSSSDDGLQVKPIGQNGGAAHWENASSLGAYSVSSDDYSDAVNATSPDSHLGLSWQQAVPSSVNAARAALNTQGGVIRVIVLGETAQWLNAFGYTYSGKPTDAQSFTAFRAIQSVGPGANVHFGDYIDIPLNVGEAAKFDFWYYSAGQDGLVPPFSTNGLGGIYTAFNPSNGDPSSTTNQFLWASDSLKINTSISGTGGFMGVDTYMVGMEDWQLSTGSDRDYSDLRIGLQFFDANGTPLATIPEPAQIGFLLVSLVGVITILRRRPITTAPVQAT